MQKAPVITFMEKYCLPNFTQKTHQLYDEAYQELLNSKYIIWPIENLPLWIVSMLDEISQFNDLSKTIDTLETLEIEDPESFEVDPRFESMIDQHIEHLDDIAYITGYTFENKYFAKEALHAFFPGIIRRGEDESNAVIRNNPARLEIDDIYSEMHALYLLVPATEEQQQRTLDTADYVRPGTGAEYQDYLGRRSNSMVKYMKEISKGRTGTFMEQEYSASQENPSQDRDNSEDKDTFGDFLGGFLFDHFLRKK